MLGWCCCMDGMAWMSGYHTWGNPWNRDKLEKDIDLTLPFLPLIFGAEKNKNISLSREK